MHPPQDPPTDSGHPAASWGPSPASPLVGREREQSALRECLAAALAGRGSLVLIGGEAGVGKTALAEATLADATAQGALVLVGRCYDLTETPPYGPWREAFDRTPGDSELPTLPSTVLPPEREGEALSSQEAIFRRVRDYLTALATRQSLLLLLDDLHWADPASLDLLRFLARQLADLPLLLLATYRADELTRRHPLSQLLPLLVREARATRLDLHPLDHDALAALLRTRYALPADAEMHLTGYLAGRAEGNPLFTGELLRALEESGALRLVGATWALRDLAAVGVPPLLRQVIDARVDRLGEDARKLLALAAVIGQEVPLDLWATLGDTTDEVLAATIERAIEARLLATTPDGDGVRFAHALIREALYEGTLPLRRRGWHRRIGEALAAAPAADPDAVAHHFRQAGDPRSAEWLIAAGARAQRGYAWRTATARYEAALKLYEERAQDGAARAALLVRLAHVGRYVAPEQSLDYLEEAARWGTRGGDHALAAYATYEGGLMRCFMGDLSSGLAALEQGAAAQEALSPVERTHLGDLLTAIDEQIAPDSGWGTLALWLDMAGRFAEARAIAERAVAEAAPGADADAALIDIYASLGFPQEARRAATRACERHRASGHHLQLGLTLLDVLTLIALPYDTEDIPGRQRLAEQAEQALARAASVLPDGDLTVIARLPLLYIEGRWQEARHLAEMEPNFRSSTAANCGRLLRASGDRENAWNVIRDWLPAGTDTVPGEVAFRPAVDLQVLAAHLALDAGDRATAHAWLTARGRWLDWSGAVLGRAEEQSDWARYHRAAGDVVAARAHAERALAHATEPRQPFALLAAHRLLGELDTAEGRHADAQAHLDAALALADACAAPYERALTLLALAELHAAEGHAAEGERALAEACAILVPLEATPALARADALAARLAMPPAPLTLALAEAAPFALTTREVAVLRLVADGLTDPQIAEHLFVSRHTVNAHLRNIYGKLGVNSRAAATRAALEHGLV